MLIKEKVIFDTNCIFNKKATSFLGNKHELAEFSKVSEIIIPKTAIEEIEARYKRFFSEEKTKFLNTLLPSIVQNNFDNIDVDARIQELKDAEEISYKEIELTDFSILPKMKDLAIKKLPPFESGNGTDKGFKDAYIFFTILEYIQSIPDKYVFVCLKDKKFKEAFKDYPNIHIIENFKEFNAKSISRYKNPYFIDKINDENNLDISAEDIIDTWINIDSNTNMLIRFNNEEYIIEIDSGEIINFINKNEFIDSIRDLVSSGSFGTTHRTIGELEDCKNLLSDDEISKILEASITNAQINWIISDEDVGGFIRTLYSKKSDILDEETNIALQDIFSTNTECNE